MVCCYFFRSYLLGTRFVDSARILDGTVDGQEQLELGENERRLASQLANIADPLPLTADNEDYASAHHVDDGSLTDAAVNLAERSPRFEDPSGHANVTVQLGGTAFLNCRVLDLQDKTVITNIELCVLFSDFLSSYDTVARRRHGNQHATISVGVLLVNI